MNERIKELKEQAWTLVSNEERDRGELYGAREQWERCDQKFAELIVKECAKRVDYWESRQGEHADDLLKHFGVEQSKGWVCSKCGVNRTCAVCPLGYTASLTGHCPMTAEAQ
jgi:hypothetical protein